MSRFQRFVRVGTLASAASLLAACSSYYMVRDPVNGNTYYTHKVKDAGKAGSVRFVDERTNSVVTLPQSEVTEISGREFKNGVREH